MYAEDHPWRENEKQELEVKIRRQYQLGTQSLLPQDHHRLMEGLEEILQLPVDQQRHWIQSMIAARFYYEQHGTAIEDHTPPPAIVRMRTDMAGWLHGRL